MRKTAFTFKPSHRLLKDIPMDVLLKLFSNFLPFAEQLEESLELPEDYSLLWALKCNAFDDSPTLPSMFAKVSLCSTARVPRAFDGLVNPNRWSLCGNPGKTSLVVISIAESKLLIQITQEQVERFGEKIEVDKMLSLIRDEFATHLTQKQEVCS